MKRLHHASKLFVSGLCVLWLGLAARQAAQGPMSVTPANPTISVGQTQQFTASGAITPTSVSAGGEFTCVRLPDGTARCAGRNQFGQLGDGTWTDSSVLGPVSGLTTVTRSPRATSSRARSLRTARRSAGGSARPASAATGSSEPSRSRPVHGERPHGGRRARAGYRHACALLSNGTMRCWGENVEGQLGNGTTANPGTAQPVTVSGISGATAVTTGAYHTCALLRTARCGAGAGTARGSSATGRS